MDRKNAAAIMPKIIPLALPLMAENICRAALNSADVLMLTAFSEDAVAGVGITSQYIFFIQLIFMVIVIGVNILSAQYLGAGNREKAKETALAGMQFVTLCGVIIGIAMILSAPVLIGFYAITDSAKRFAEVYLSTMGYFAPFIAINIVCGSLLRVYGHSRTVMLISLLTLTLNIVGNGFSLFGFWGFPVLGVQGVAFSTGFSVVVSCCILLGRLLKNTEITLRDFRGIVPPWSSIGQIIKYGFPSAGENISYRLSQTVIMGILAAIAQSYLTAFILFENIIRYMWLIPLSLGQGVQIQTGYYVGAKEFDTVKRKVIRYALYGYLAVILVFFAVNGAKGFFLPHITDNSVIIEVISTLLLFSIIHETGRNFNCIFLLALKGAGDVYFPAVLGVIFHWLFRALLGYVLAIPCGLGIYGIFGAITLDECMRALIFGIRWKRGTWIGKRSI